MAHNMLALRRGKMRGRARAPRNFARNFGGRLLT